MQQVKPRNGVRRVFSWICQMAILLVAIMNAVATLAFLYISIQSFSEQNYTEILIAYSLLFVTVFYTLISIGLWDYERIKLAS